MNIWYKGVVLVGLKNGTKLGFPTTNLHSGILPASYKNGVYACLVKYNNRIYKGALYFGPRLVYNENNQVLEIYLINFTGNLYGQTLEFKLGKFIRKPLDFKNTDDLKKQLAVDVKAVDS